MKKLTALFLALALCLSLCTVTAFAAPAAESDFAFDTSTGTITEYKGAGGDVEIPATIGDVAVTGIGVNAFHMCSSLVSVTIPNSVTSIGDNAFNSCSSLASVTIPSSVTSIGQNAFYYCTSLASVTIPNSVTSIGQNAFYYCTSLASVTIPNSVTSIGDGAFYGCTSLTGVTIPSSVTSIGDWAFYGCTSLTGVTVEGDTPPTLGVSVFSNCDTNLKIYVPADKVEIYKEATNWSSYADWIEAIPTYYTVTFDANGHGTAPAAITHVLSGSKVNKPTDPTAAGYTFGGWYKEAGCTNAWNFDTDTVTANTTLYAKWTKTGGGHHGGSSTTTTPTVTAPKTADAGIALYSVLTVSSLLGMGWVSKKKR